jgi:muramidase (phage lysozyme)
MALTEIQRRLLNAIAGPESAGRYDVRYTPSGGTTFSGYEQHPRIYETIPKSGKRSSAAGRYQIIYDTYKRMGGGSFYPADQDRMALQLAEQRYKNVTGRDIYSDIQKFGMNPSILGSLKGEWAAFTNPAGVAKGIRWYNAPLDGAQALASPTRSAPVPPARPPASFSDIGQGAKVIASTVFDPFIKAGNAIAGREIVPEIAATPPPAAAVSAASGTPSSTNQFSAAGGALANLAKLVAESNKKPAMMQPVYNKAARGGTNVNLAGIMGSPQDDELKRLMGLLGGGGGGYLE